MDIGQVQHVFQACDKNGDGGLDEVRQAAGASSRVLRDAFSRSARALGAHRGTDSKAEHRQGRRPAAQLPPRSHPRAPSRLKTQYDSLAKPPTSSLRCAGRGDLADQGRQP